MINSIFLSAGVGVHSRTADPTAAALPVCLHHVPCLPGPAAALQHGGWQTGLSTYTRIHLDRHTQSRKTGGAYLLAGHNRISYG